MKYSLFLMLVLMLSAYQSRDDSKQEAKSTAPATDSAEVAMLSPATPDFTYLIVPGESIGRISLKMPAVELHINMGKPDSGEAAMSQSPHFWISKDGRQPRQYVATCTVNSFDEAGRQQVQVTSAQFRTGSGLGLGNTLAQIRKEYRQVEPLAYYTNQKQQQVYIFNEQARGIAFEVTVPNSIWAAVTVHAKGTDENSTYLPVHPNMTRLK